MKHLTLALFAFLLTFSASSQPVKKVGGVVVEGNLTNAEKALIRRLDDRLIPLPPKISVRSIRGNGAWDGRQILLSRNRHESPAQANREMLYLYGQSPASMPSKVFPENVHTLAHEIAHSLQWRIWYGRPRLPGVLWWKTESAARGPFAIRRETEADLMAAALLKICFQMNYRELGFPEKTWAGRTDSLVQGYAARLGDVYRFPVEYPFDSNIDYSHSKTE